MFTTIIILSLLLLVLGVALALVAGTLFTKPIRSLMENVRRLDPNQPVHLPPVNIREIDALSTAVERLSRDVAESSSRLTQIIDMVGIPLAAFELADQPPLVYYTKEFFPLIGRAAPARPPTPPEFLQLLQGLDAFKESATPDGSTVIYKITEADGSGRWLRLQFIRREEITLGVMADITKDMAEKQRIEYERDYDLLTSLLNRRAFQSRLGRLAADPAALGTAAMLMLDLDNLKFVNDSYGHDCGDTYICCAADVLRSFSALGGLVGRISGDEFNLFLSGFSNREALNQMLVLLRQRMDDASILLPDGKIYRLRASVGVAWYPDDSRSLPELIRYADFAMYQAKNAVKGSMKHFDLNSYQRDSFLLYSREELNRILDEGALDYAFQPIVSCATGGIMGYEALMRPRSQTLPTPLEVLRLARAQYKLMQIERLTWFRALESFSLLADTVPDSLIFINSIPSLVLDEADFTLFDDAFRPYLHRICVEITESDELNDDATQRKQHRCRELHMRLAMDDYGTGYSNDSLLLTLKPDFVKVDMSIIRGIDTDKTRQTLFRNMVSLCREMGAQVIAEGVETEAELRVVVALGADFIQGYFLCKPAMQPVPPTEEALAILRDANAKIL